MRRKHLLSLFFLVCISVGALAQTSLEGKITDAESGEPIIFCNVALFKNGNLATGSESDLDGNYFFSNIDPGNYAVEVSYVGYQTQRIENVVILSGKTNRLDIKLSQGTTLDLGIEVVDYVVPLIEQDNTTQGQVVTAEKIRNLPTRSVNSIASTTAGLSSIDGGSINIRGSRSNATQYYIDGIRVSGRSIPSSEIEQMQVLTGGIPASYGDVGGGIIALISKGPSARYSAGLEFESSQYLDPFGYNLASANVSGPIIKNKDGQSLLSFRLAGQLLFQKDDGPRIQGAYYADEATIAELEANPITYIGTTPINSSEFLRDGESNPDGDLFVYSSRPNENSRSLDINGKLDARLSKNIDVSLSGTFADTRNQFTPGGWGYYNYKRNPTNYGNSYRGIFRFRHRLGSTYTPSNQNAEERKANTSLIRNASYSLQAGYQVNTGRTEDPIHKDNLFRYGYVGSFEKEYVPAVGEVEIGDSTFLGHVGYTETLTGYVPGDHNPILTNYNSALYQEFGLPNSLFGFLSYNGTLVGQHASSWGLHRNVGQVYNSFGKNDNEVITFSANSSFDFFPTRSDGGRHNIEFGVLYEQRTSNNWNVSPYGLWNLARLQANSHITGVDPTIAIDTFTLGGQIFDEYQTLIETDDDLLFYKSIRELVGKTDFEYVNIDEINPDDLSLDMFSVQELVNFGYVGFNGYDYLGNKLDRGVTFDDFFTDRDERGNLKFTNAPFRPIYIAGYLQDKFSYKDVIFRLGVRMDRYDANTKVLIDPYALYDIQSAEEFHAQEGTSEQPANINDDFKVYVAEDGSKQVIAYRKDDQWYNKEGSPVNDGKLIFSGGNVFPAYKPHGNIQSDTFQVSSSFRDYEPQTNFMPRLAFSFPISDEANFFAHYDVLVQRPTSNVYVSPRAYYYFEEAGRTPGNNPNLKPQKTIDYEVGFQQKLTASSALKIAAYYKEIRDQIAIRTYLNVATPVNSYDTYGNLDFGTVKGFSFTYDLRRTNNLEMVANYTLQFAEGTGSDANSQGGLTKRGNIRTIYPLNYDDRHNVNLTLDYRYSSGKRYNGPRWGGINWFENAGLNVRSSVVSGRPYTKLQRALPFGGEGFEGALNGARRPWRFNLDLRADKNFKAGPLFFNVYISVQNVLNTKNIVGVYPVTGSPTDDGYLTSTDGLSALNTIRESRQGISANEQAYLDAYNWSLFNSYGYSLPRRIRLGLLFDL